MSDRAIHFIAGMTTTVVLLAIFRILQAVLFDSWATGRKQRKKERAARKEQERQEKDMAALAGILAVDMMKRRLNARCLRPKCPGELRDALWRPGKVAQCPRCGAYNKQYADAMQVAWKSTHPEPSDDLISEYINDKAERERANGMLSAFGQNMKKQLEYTEEQKSPLDKEKEALIANKLVVAKDLTKKMEEQLGQAAPNATEEGPPPMWEARLRAMQGESE